MVTNRTGTTVPDGCLFKFSNKKDAVCGTKGCDRVYKHVNQYYLFKSGNKKLCRTCAKKKGVI